jgi:hypothetical protein
VAISALPERSGELLPRGENQVLSRPLGGDQRPVCYLNQFMAIGVVAQHADPDADGDGRRLVAEAPLDSHSNALRESPSR